MSKVYLSIGSNKGNRSVLINKAIDEIENNIGIIISRSSIYQSKSWGFDSNDFYNLCLLIETDIEPESLLIDLKKIEKQMLDKVKDAYKTNPEFKRVIDKYNIQVN